jgi:hypothetical protein
MCPTYAVLKWKTDNDRSAALYGNDPQLLWRICSSGFEKHVIDIAQGKTEQQHILTALRVMKLYFRNGKEKAKSRHETPEQVFTVLRSYYLKHIAFYCILFLTVLNHVQLKDLETALSYMLEFLSVCLEEKKLPHFFQANEHIHELFPDVEAQESALRYNLFKEKRGDALNQATLSFRSMKRKICSIIGSVEIAAYVVREFREYILEGNYY